jgi:hypothetical protein
MKFFLTLLTVNFVSFAGEISIIATVNQTPITTFDVKERVEILQELLPDFKKYRNEEQQMLALQNVVQDALKQEYIKRVNFTITKAEERIYHITFVEMLQSMGVENTDAFIKKYPNFVHDETLWQGVVEKTIKPSINIIDEIIDAVHAQKPDVSKEQLRIILMQQQVQSQTAQLLESVKNISVIEIKAE